MTKDSSSNESAVAQVREQLRLAQSQLIRYARDIRQARQGHQDTQDASELRKELDIAHTQLLKYAEDLQSLSKAHKSQQQTLQSAQRELAVASRQLQDFATVAGQTDAAEIVKDTVRSVVGKDVAPIAESARMASVLSMCRKVAAAEATVLLQGETGTGKEVCATFIHQHSQRRNATLVALNCAALPETLLENELFGHEKGAFTSADEVKIGLLESAHNGTLFLDEVGEMSLSLQAKLLRVIEQRQITRVGGNSSIDVDVRIIAATNRDLREESDEGRFRSDLYYRLNVFPVVVPPLRERREDIVPLVDHFLLTVAARQGLHPPVLGRGVIEAMTAYGWPGNIRELRNVVERCMLLADEGVIELRSLPVEIGGDHAARASHSSTNTGESVLARQERELILSTLQETGWNQSAAARILGIKRETLRYRMQKYGLRSAEGSS